jgi:hypothetical protein
LPELYELKKADAKLLVRDGEKNAQARVKTEGGEVRMFWPDCLGQASGAEPPRASVYAAGLSSIAEISPKERAAELGRYLKADPTKADLAQTLGEQFSPAAVDRLWEEIDQRGWDGAYADQETRRRDARRDWEKLTGAGFGSEKAAAWRPGGWDPLMDNLTAGDVEQQLAEARETLEAAIADAAVDLAELTRLRELSRDLDARQDSLSAASLAASEAGPALEAAIARRKGLPEPARAGGMPCPHCGGALMLHRDGPVTTLVKHESLPDAENKTRQMAIAAADGETARLTAAKTAAYAAIAVARGDLDAAAAARDKIAALGEKKGAAGMVDRGRERVAGLERDLAMVKQAAEATTLYRRWLGAHLKLEALAPAGLRARKLGEATQAFNEGVLAPLSEAAGVDRVNLTRELSVRLGERPYRLVSESQQFLARAVLQLAQARLDGSTMVVIDRADILDGPGKSGLFAMLRDAMIPALVAMTATRPEQLPDLEAAGLGQSMWIEGAVARPFGQ